LPRIGPGQGGNGSFNLSLGVAESSTLLPHTVGQGVLGFSWGLAGPGSLSLHLPDASQCNAAGPLHTGPAIERAYCKP
jgi:hypothetical protein